MIMVYGLSVVVVRSIEHCVRQANDSNATDWYAFLAAKNICNFKKKKIVSTQWKRDQTESWMSVTALWRTRTGHMGTWYDKMNSNTADAPISKIKYVQLINCCIFIHQNVVELIDQSEALYLCRCDVNFQFQFVVTRLSHKIYTIHTYGSYIYVVSYVSTSQNESHPSIYPIHILICSLAPFDHSSFECVIFLVYSRCVQHYYLCSPNKCNK